jgi:hypothetical protein
VGNNNLFSGFIEYTIQFNLKLKLIGKGRQFTLIQLSQHVDFAYLLPIGKGILLELCLHAPSGNSLHLFASFFFFFSTVD